MYDLDCPICLNSSSFENFRSLPCGHTYCSSCVAKLIDEIDELSTCPECRSDFKPENVRRLFIKPSSNGSGSQRSSRNDSESPCNQDGFIKQAKHIARRLQRLDAKSPADSVKNAADVIEQVAMIQCKAAQEIIWKAVRAFWMNLVADFAKLDEFEEFRVKISSLEQRMEDLEVLENTRSGLLLEVEKERNRAQQYLAVVEDKTRDIDKLVVALRTAQDEAEEERERQHVLIARLRASELKQRTQIKQLKMGLKRKTEASTRSNDESLVVEPGEAYKTSSHRLDIYNDNTPGPNPKRHKFSLEASTPDSPSSPGHLSDHWASTSSTPPTESHMQARERTGKTHQSSARPELALVPPSPRRPKFGSDWNFSRQHHRRKLTGKSNSATLPFPLDAQGRPKGLLKYGSRVRMKAK